MTLATKRNAQISPLPSIYVSAEHMAYTMLYPDPLPVESTPLKVLETWLKLLANHDFHALASTLSIESLGYALIIAGCQGIEMDQMNLV